MIEIYCDGICEPNPGFACWAWIAKRDGRPFAMIFDNLGNGYTNNDAEYVAVGKAIRWIFDEAIQEPVIIYTDSQLVVKQVNGEWQCNVHKLQVYRDRIRSLLLELPQVELKWISSADNGDADQLTRIAYLKATGRQAPIRHKAQGR